MTPAFNVSLVLLDLDGTLVDTAPDLALAVNRMLIELGHEAQPSQKIATWIGNGMTRLVERALTGDMDGQVEPALLQTAIASFQKHYAAHVAVHSQLFPGALALLERLSGAGFKLGCITNKPAMFTLPLLQQLAVARYFGVIVAGDTVAQKKPHPLPLEHACRHFGVAPTQALLIGDSAADVEAARAAGMPVIAVSYGYNHGRDVRELHPDRVVDSLAEVPQYLHLYET